MANTAFVLCLDSLASGQSLHLHVSKPPKDDTEGDIFLKVSCTNDVAFTRIHYHQCCVCILLSLFNSYIIMCALTNVVFCERNISYIDKQQNILF